MQIGLKLAIESTLTGLHRAGVLDDAKLDVVLAELDRASFAARGNLPAESELIESIADNVRFMVRQPPID